MEYTQYFKPEELTEINYVLQGWKNKFGTINPYEEPNIFLIGEKFKMSFSDHSNGLNSICDCEVISYDQIRNTSIVKAVDIQNGSVSEIKFLGTVVAIFCGADTQDIGSYYYNDKSISFIDLDKDVKVRYPNGDALKQMYKIYKK